MDRRLAAARRLAALLLVALAASAAAETVNEGFDLRYRIRFGMTDGAVAAWLDGTQVVDYEGALGDPDDGPEMDFRFGLYRDRLATPMVIYFDDFRKERLAQ